MDESDSQEAGRANQTPNETDAPSGHTEAQADQATEGLREQIAALRRQVKDAQDTLRDHHRRRQEGRSFKR